MCINIYTDIFIAKIVNVLLLDLLKTNYWDIFSSYKILNRF